MPRTVTGAGTTVRVSTGPASSGMVPRLTARLRSTPYQSRVPSVYWSAVRVNSSNAPVPRRPATENAYSIRSGSQACAPGPGTLKSSSDHVSQAAQAARTSARSPASTVVASSGGRSVWAGAARSRLPSSARRAIRRQYAATSSSAPASAAPGGGGTA